MARKPADLAESMSNRDALVDGIVREIFRLPVEAARVKAREIIRQAPLGGEFTIVERWLQLPDGMIEITMRRMHAGD